MLTMGILGSNGTLDYDLPAAMPGTAGYTISAYISGPAWSGSGTQDYGCFGMANIDPGEAFNYVALEYQATASGTRIRGVWGGSPSTVAEVFSAYGSSSGVATFRVASNGRGSIFWQGNVLALNPPAGDRPNGMNRFFVGYTNYGLSSYRFARDVNIGEVAVYSRALTNQECLALGLGFSPLLVRRQGLRWYSRLLTQSEVGGAALDDFINLADTSEAFTETANSISNREHIPVLYPESPFVQSRPSGGGGPPPTTMPPDLIDGDRLGSLIHRRMVG